MVVFFSVTSAVLWAGYLASFSSLDNIGQATVAGAIGGGSVLGLPMGAWEANSAFVADLKSGIGECMQERGYRIRAWE